MGKESHFSTNTVGWDVGNEEASKYFRQPIRVDVISGILKLHATPKNYIMRQLGHQLYLVVVDSLHFQQKHAQHRFS